MNLDNIQIHPAGADWTLSYLRMGKRRTELSNAEISEVLTVEQLAKFIHKTPASIRSDASRNPIALPPICRLPGSKRLLWLLDDVRQWMSACVDRSNASSVQTFQAADPSIARKRGRPRKTAARVSRES